MQAPRQRAVARLLNCILREISSHTCFAKFSHAFDGVHGYRTLLASRTCLTLRCIIYCLPMLGLFALLPISADGTQAGDLQNRNDSYFARSCAARKTL